MRLLGKIIGLLVGGPFGWIGLLLGVFIGHLFDTGAMQRGWRRFVLMRVVRSGEQRDAFFNEVFRLMGYVAKSDGRVSGPEIEAAEKAMKHMGLGRRLREEAIGFFSEGKQASFEANDSLERLMKAYGSQTAMLRMAYEMIEAVARSDSPILSGPKKAVMQMIGRVLGIQQRFSFDDLFEQFRRAAGNAGSGQGASSSSSTMSSSSAYKMLDVSQSATDGEVKKAYRKQMSRYHPDRMIAQKKSEEDIAQATEKTQAIKKAYESICQARGAA